MILKTLSWGPMHGYGIGRWIEELGASALRIDEGSLYPALYRLEAKDWVEAEWGITEKKRRAKYYKLTPKGRAALKANASLWADFARAVATVLSATSAPRDA